jgi:alkylated DNA repair protein (DNA oxidative demethylase)
MKDVAIKSGVFSIPQQKYIYQKVRQIEPGFYVPTLRYGNKMRIQMNCLGLHWNAKTYQYDKNRTDHDNEQVAEIPEWLQQVALTALRVSEYMPEEELRPFDICICNFYTEENGKLGIHKDDSERKSSLDTGYPVVSVSIGADAKFVIGKSRKKADLEEHILKSGDVAIFGRSARLAYHGITSLIEGTTPEELGFEVPGRLNLTFRIF